MGEIEDWNPAEHLDVEQRYGQLAEMRQRCPVAFSSRGKGVYDVLRHADLVAIAGDPARFGNAGKARFGRAVPPLEYDPPEHRDFRRALAVFFTPKRIARLEPVIRSNARRLLAPMLERGEGDLARDFAYPMPVLALCALLDISADDWPQIKDWSEQTLLHDSPDPAERDLGWAGHEQIVAYAHGMIADRRANPRDPESDITAAYLAAHVRGAGLDDDVIAAALRLLISAGHNSTTSAMGNCILRLATDAELQARLRREPAQIVPAVEEFLRLDTPVQQMPRWVQQECEIAGRKLPAGAQLGLFFGSANRDEAVFADADVCIIDRRPNRHIAFGCGIHTCVGAPLARLELRVALEELLAATSQFAVAGTVERPSFHRIGVTTLPLRLTPADAG